MKRTINILLVVVALLTVQACARKADTAKEEAEKAAALSGIKKPAAEATPEQRRAAADKKRAVLAEKRQLAREEVLKTSTTYRDKNGELVYNKAEQDPTFNGGNRAMNIYFRDNIKFPESAQEEGLDGTVYVDFVIAANGRVGEVTSKGLPGEEVDQRFVDEAIRVVKAMPNWIPGRQHGKAVAVSFTVPVTFEIAG